MAAKDAFAGRPMLGRYVLLREIARSNDVVWEATDPQMNRRVAVKELALSPTLSGQARRERIERFYREARAAGAMSHANIVTIYEVGEMDGRYFIAMEYLEGQTLRDRLASGGPMALAEAVEIAGALCDALVYAHGRGVIHRDIKPDNVHLLPDGRVKLTDFGIARITHEDSLTMDGQVFGTPSYMSPEQVIGKEIDARSDIFSLGIVLYEMLSGRKPFTGESVVTITYRIINDEMPPLPGAPPGIEAVLRRALAKKPADRFASAAELRIALLAAARQYDALNPLPAAPRPPDRSVRQPPLAARTVGYSPRTRMDLLPSGAAASPAVVEGTWVTSMPPPPRAVRSGRNLAVVALSIFLIAGFLIGGAWLLSQAYQNQTRQARARADAEQYRRAVERYNAKSYEEAARLFEVLRKSSRDPQIIRDATVSQGICYRALGGQFVRQNDFSTAEVWFRYAVATFQDALRLAPDDPQAGQGLSQATQELNAVLAARGAPAEMLVPEPAAPGGPVSPSFAPPATLPTPSPPAGGSAADFERANANRAAEAARLLEAGNAAWNRGDREGATRLWNQAVQAGPGSEAAITALERLNVYNATSTP